MGKPSLAAAAVLALLAAVAVVCALVRIGERRPVVEEHVPPRPVRAAIVDHSSGSIPVAATAASVHPDDPDQPESASLDLSRLERHRAAVLNSQYGTAPVEELIEVLVEMPGGPQVQLVLQALALRKDEALPIVRARLRSGGLWEKVILTKFLRQCPWRETLPELRSIVRSDTEPWEARMGAVAALTAVGDLTAGPDLVELLREPDRPVALQLAAIAAVAGIGYDKATPVLEAFAQAEDVHVRLFANRALAEFGRPVDRDFLQSALRHDDYVVRLEACEALGASEGAGIPETLRTMARGDSHQAVREAAVQALLERELQGLGSVQKSERLRDALHGAERPTALWILRVLLQDGSPEAQAVVTRLSAEDNWLAERCRTQLILTAGNRPTRMSTQE